MSRLEKTVRETDGTSSPRSETDSSRYDDDLVPVPERTWKGAMWDTFDLPPKERKLLFKVDAVLLTLASVCGLFASLSVR